MVGADGAAHAADVGDVVAGADELGAAQGQQVAELRIGAVVNRPVGFHGQEFAVLVGASLQIDEERRTFAGVGHAAGNNRSRGRPACRWPWPPPRPGLPWSG